MQTVARSPGRLLAEKKKATHLCVASMHFKFSSPNSL